MDMREYQEKASRTFPVYTEQGEQLINGVLGLTGESGEVSDALKKVLFQGHQLKPEKVIEEIGDVLWYCALVCDALGVDLDYAACRNIEKLLNRYPKGFDSERSINRKE